MDRQIQKRKWPPKKIAWVSVSALFILAIAYNLIFGDHSSKLNVRAERLTVSTVYNGEFQEFIPVTGAVIPIKTNYLDAIEGGRVDTVFLEAGTTVEKGDRILKLGNTNLLLDIMYREAELVQQSNNLRNTRLTMAQRRLAVQGQILELDYQIKQQKRVFEQSSELKQKGLIAGQEYEEASDEYEYLVATRELTMEQYRQDSIYRETQIAQLEGSLARMESNLEVVRQNLDNLVLRAPISGQLTSLNAEVGESKGRGERLGQIDVLEGFKVRVPIDEHYIARVDMGLAGECTYNDSVYHLTIKKVYPEVLNGRFEVDMVFVDQSPPEIRRGQTLRIRLELGDLSQALLLASGGFYQKTGGRWVFVVDESGDMAVKRDIQLGRQNPLNYEVLSGLSAGERVITSSYDSFGEVEK
ncbi:MAG: HlyD family efflux transporter periplasmic adaptor subunit, partial [candidate division Zixibacteria bacterium]|nr:HlyD family efflux transporter periplasmic adaptor subunit [candidate division Zixibacteria bacterium]